MCFGSEEYSWGSKLSSDGETDNSNELLLHSGVVNWLRSMADDTNMQDVVITTYGPNNAPVTVKDMKSLLYDNFLNDVVVNAMMALCNRHSNSTVRFLSSGEQLRVLCFHGGVVGQV
jgi:Ulp1 family protease